MASFDPIIRMNDNVFRGPQKIKSKAVRKPLSDVTNSRKPLEKNKACAKSSNGLKGPDQVQPKVVRKPLGDLTNSQRPGAQEKSSKKNCVENVSAVSKRNGYDWVKEERIMHNHDECVEAQRQSTTLSMVYFLEIVGLKKDSSLSSKHTTRIHNACIASDFELDTYKELAEFEMDICAPPSPPTPKAPRSPGWNMDWDHLNLSPVKLKDSPVRH